MGFNRIACNFFICLKDQKANKKGPILPSNSQVAILTICLINSNEQCGTDVRFN